ncbi:MAG: MBL fold metallo-hydrolase [Lentimicrobiaceae bacterium]|nr:MBL fold metallo-hydrolase [Lentimicrobiaceae bacterium]
MKVTFLGTGTSTGVPVVACNCEVCKSTDPRDKRFRTSAMITVGDTNIVIDCGPDFRFQMLKQNVENIEAIVFTHQHRDHIAGLDDIRGFNYILNKTMDIYGAQQVLEGIRTEFPYIFTETRFFGAPQICMHTITNTPFNINGIKFIPIAVMHDKLSIFGYRIGNFTYITDASFISEQEKEKIKGSEVIVLNALRNSKHVSHFSLSEAVALIDELQPREAYLTHISHFLGLHETINKRLPQHIRLAHDNLKIEI